MNKYTEVGTIEEYYVGFNILSSGEVVLANVEEDMESKVLHNQLELVEVKSKNTLFEKKSYEESLQMYSRPAKKVSKKVLKGEYVEFIGRTTYNKKDGNILHEGLFVLYTNVENLTEDELLEKLKEYLNNHRIVVCYYTANEKTTDKLRIGKRVYVVNNKGFKYHKGNEYGTIRKEKVANSFDEAKVFSGLAYSMLEKYVVYTGKGIFEQIKKDTEKNRIVAVENKKEWLNDMIKSATAQLEELEKEDN